MSLTKKVALITGGSQGIGEAVARRFAREGAIVAVVASSDVRKADAVADRIGKDGGNAQAYVCDVRHVKPVHQLVASVERDLGPISIVVPSAGVYYPTPAGATEESDFDRMVDINLKGTWNVINAAVPGMKARKSGNIILISSVAGVMGLSRYGVYSACKAGLIMLTRALAAELAGEGINVNCIAPGNTKTPMNEDIRTKPELKPALDLIRSRTPSSRIYSDPDDMAGIALFLASDAARAMHGSCLLADEGISAGI